MSDYVVNFEAAAATDTAIVGAKVAQLVKTGAEGFTTPKGFAVTTRAFLDFMESVNAATDLSARLAAFEDRASDDAADLALFAEQAITAQAVPENMGAEITAAYEALCLAERHVDCPVAVRSSATGEDAEDASFAGQYESFLGVSGSAQLLDYVKRGWASLFTARALQYRRDNGLAYAATPMALGIMTLVNARAAGVGFSVHPVKGTADRMVIEATFGFGEALVQGVVTPDHIEVDKQSGRILEYSTNAKTTVSVLDVGAATVIEKAMPEAFVDAQVLTEAEITAIAGLLVEVEKKAGFPVDIEWVVPHGWQTGMPISLVQMRPVTTHVAKPEESGDDPDEGAKPGWKASSFATRYGGKRRRRPKGGSDD